MQKTTITITEATTKREALNAVRRAFAEDAPLKAGERFSVKGVKVRVDEVQTVRKASLKHVREWAAKQGTVLGKRGRIPAEVLAAYTSTHKAK